MTAGLTAFPVAHYTFSSSGLGDNRGRGGGDNRASVNTVEGLLLSSSVDLRSASDNTCVPATGTWGGKSFNGNGDTPFETCYKNKYNTEEECWSKSYYDGDWLECFL